MDNVNSQRRRNKSTLRRRQAQFTADEIVNAARALFLERGYAGTTIEAIAERADVAASTVYAVYGSKRSILRSIRSAWHERTHIREVTYGDLGDMPPEERIEMLARGSRQQWEMGGDVIAIYTGAASSDPEAAAELKGALEGRREGMQRFAAGLEPHLRPGLDAARAAAILQALGLPELYNTLVHESGWSADEYQAWLAAALKRELLGKKE